MHTTAAVVCVLLAATASAAPPKRDATERVPYSAKRPAPPRSEARRPGEWIELATPTPAKHGTEFIVVDRTLGPLARLRIVATGRVIVRRVKVTFDDGTRRSIAVGKVLHPGRRSTIVELGYEAPVEMVVVETEPYTRGSYTLHGSTGASRVVRR